MIGECSTGQLHTFENAFSVLPNELLGVIFKKCHPDDLGNLSEVSTLWNREVNKIKAEGLGIFGVEAWRELGFIVEKAPPIPRRINQITRSDRKRFEGQNKALPFSLILMPKGLTLNKMTELMLNKKISYREMWTPILFELGDQAIEESYWILITNDVIEGSRGMTYSKQKELVDRKSGSQCQVPPLLGVIVCCVMNYLKDGTYLFGEPPGTYTYTRCQEIVENQPLSVGGFTSSGFYVSCFHDNGHIGVTASRKFYDLGEN